MSTRKAIGIIDGDYISENHISSLEKENIFTIAVPDIENLLLVEAVLLSLAKNLSLGSEIVNQVQREILIWLENDRNLQVSKFISSKVDHYMKDSNVAQGKNISDLKSNFSKFIGNVNIDSWSTKRSKEIDKVVTANDYHGAIRIFKNKSLSSTVNKYFKIKDFEEQAIRLLKDNSELRSELLKYFSPKLS